MSRESLLKSFILFLLFVVFCGKGQKKTSAEDKTFELKGYPFVIISDCAMGSEEFNDTEDGVALFFALLSRKVCIRAIISTFGNVGEEEAFSNIKKIVELSQDYALCVPEVWRGASEPREDVSEGALKLVELVRQTQRKVGVISLGSLTTLRQALDIYPSFPSKISLYVMGGAVNVLGNVPPDFRAEANFAFDPDATRKVIQNFHAEIYPLDLAYKFHVTDVIESFSGKIGKYILETSAEWFSTPFAFLFDTLAVAGALYPKIITNYEILKIDIGSRGEVKLVRSREGEISIPEHKFVFDIDREKFIDIFRRIFEGK